MFELIGVASVLLVGLVLVGLAWAALSLFFGLVLLPFKLLGLMFRGLAALLALPFLLIFGLAALILFGAGALVFLLLPLLPLALVVLAVILLARRGRGAGATPATP